MTSRDPVKTDAGRRPIRPARALAGLVMVLAGSLILLGLVVVGNCSTELCQKVMFGLGLAQTALISAIAQGLVLGGLGMLWTAVRRSDG